MSEDEILGLEAYKAYCEATGFRNEDLDHEQSWHLNPKMQYGWIAAARAVRDKAKTLS